METSASFEARSAPLLYPTNQVDFWTESMSFRNDASLNQAMQK
jgi:hypothetical protein